MISTIAALPIRRYAEAAVVAAVPKSVGSCFRYKDAQNADPSLKRNVAMGEALTVAQLSVYTIMAQECYEFLKNVAKSTAGQITQKYGDVLKQGTQHLPARDRTLLMMSQGMERLAKNRAMFLMGLGCLANYTAETVSRLRFKRDLAMEVGANGSKRPTLNRAKEKDGPHENPPDSREDHKRGRRFFSVHTQPSFGQTNWGGAFPAYPAASYARNPFSAASLPPVAPASFSV